MTQFSTSRTWEFLLELAEEEEGRIRKKNKEEGSTRKKRKEEGTRRKKKEEEQEEGRNRKKEEEETVRRRKKLEEGRRKKEVEERRRKEEEGGRRRKKEEGRRKKEEGRRKKEEGRRKKEEGRHTPAASRWRARQSNNRSSYRSIRTGFPQKESHAPLHTSTTDFDSMFGAEGGKGSQTGWAPDMILSGRPMNVCLVSPTSSTQPGVPLTGRLSPPSLTTEPPRFGTEKCISTTHVGSSCPKLCERLSLKHKGFQFTELPDPDTQPTVPSSSN